MAGTTVDYIIRLLRDDSDLKKQLKATERDITNLNAHERSEVKATLQAKMDALAAQAKAAKKSHSSGSVVDTKGLEDELNFIKEVFKEMKSLNPADDWAKSGKVFAQTFTNMHNQLSDLANSVETLKSSVAELNTSFQNLGFKTTSTSNISSMAKDVDKIAESSAKISANIGSALVDEKVIKRANALKTILTSLSKENLELNIADGDLDQAFDDASEAVDQLTDRIEDYKKIIRDVGIAEDQRKKARQALTRDNTKLAQSYLKLMAIDERRVKLGKASLIAPSGDPQEYKDTIAGWEKQILSTTERVQSALSKLESDITSTLGKSFSKVISEQISDIKLTLKLPSEDAFVADINNYIAEINKKPLENIKVGIENSANVIEDKHKQGYKDNSADDDVNTTKLVEKTEARFQAVYDAIDKKQGQILDKTKEWRSDMLKELKFKNGDFEFNFGGDLFQSLQDYLNEQGNELKFVVDQETIKEQLKTVIENSGLTIGGLGGTSTAVVDANAIAKAVYAGMQAAVTGQPLPSFNNSNTTSASKDTVPSGNKNSDNHDDDDELDKYVKIITEKTINSDRVIEALRKFALASTKKGAGRQAVAKWLTEQGINIDSINRGASDDAIRKMLNEALMKKDRFGYARGALFADALSGDNLRAFGVTSDRQKADVGNVVSEVAEMLSRMGISQEYWQQSRDRYDSYKSYKHAAKFGRPIATLGQVQKPLYANSMKDFADGGYKRLTDNKYIGNLDSLISLIDGLDSKHVSKANQALREAQEKAVQLDKEFNELNTKSEEIKKNLDTTQAEYDRLKAIPEDQLTPQDKVARDKAKRELDDLTNQYAWNRRDAADKRKEYKRLMGYTDKDGKKVAGEIEELYQKELEKHSSYNDAKKQIRLFKDSILGLGENPSEEAINALEQVARDFFEKSGKMMQKLFNNYGDTDTFQGRVTLQNGRVVDINSPYDFLGIKDDEIADVEVYKDILQHKWERSQSVKKGIPQDFETPSYYAKKPAPPVDIENERIESQEFTPIDAEKTPNLTNVIKAAEHRVQRLSEENKTAAQEVEQLTNEIQAKEQEVERLSGLVNSLSEAEKQALTKEAEKTEKILADRQDKQKTEQANIKKIDADIYTTEEAIKSLQNPVTSEELTTKYNDLDHRIAEITKNNDSLEQSKLSAYGAYEKALLEHEEAKKAYDDYIEKLVNEALQEASKSGEIKKLAEERSISSLEAMGILRDKLQKDFNLSGREDISTLRRARTEAGMNVSNTRGTGAKDVYDRIAGQLDSNNKFIAQLKRERDSLTVEALQAERDVALQQKQAALQELRYQKKLAVARLQRAQKTEQSSADALANNVVLQQMEAEKELKALRLKHGQLSGRVEETGVALASEQTSKERLELQSQYNQLKAQELKLQREIEQLEDGDAKNTKTAELETTIQKLSEVEAKIVALGGTVHRVAQKKYTEEQKRADALRQAEEIQNKLIEAKAQQRAYQNEVKEIETLEENVRHGGLTSSIGVQEERKFKSSARKDFRNSEYYRDIYTQKRDKLYADYNDKKVDGLNKKLSKLEELVKTTKNQEEIDKWASQIDDIKSQIAEEEQRAPLGKFIHDQASSINAIIEQRKEEIRDQVVQKVIGKKDIDLNAIRKTAIDEYVKTDGYKKVMADASAVRTSRQAEADSELNREVNEYINNLIATEMAKRNVSADADKRAKEQNISVEDARKAIEQEIRRDVEQQYKEEIRQFTGQANIRKQQAYASAKIEEQKARSDARDYVGDAAEKKEIEKIAKDKASEIERKQKAAIKEFEMSAEYANMHETALNNVKQKQRELWDALDKAMDALVDKYIASLETDKGRISFNGDKFNDEAIDQLVATEMDKRGSDIEDYSKKHQISIDEAREIIAQEVRRSIVYGSFNDFIAKSPYSLSGQNEVDLKQYILNELAERKAIAKGESAGQENLLTEKQQYIKGLPQLIADFEKNLADALAYGGFEEKELANSDLLQNIIDKTAKLKAYEQELDNKAQELIDAIANLEDAKKQNKDTKPYKDRVKELKAEIKAKEELIDREEASLENDREQLALRAEERAASSAAISDKLAKAEQRVATAKETLVNVKKEISELEKTAKEAETKHGQDSPEAERARLNLLYKQRRQATLERNISRDEKKIQRWSNKVATTDSVPVASGSTSTRGGIFDGVISEMRAIASSMSGGTIDVDGSDIATETTLRAIFEMLSGGGQASVELDAQKARGKEEREAIRREEQARVIAEIKKQAENSASQQESKQPNKSQKATDKLSVEGQEKLKAIEAKGKEILDETKKIADKTIVKNIKDQAIKLSKMTKGTVEYLEEQYKLSNMVFAYADKLKASDPNLKGYKHVLERPEIKALNDISEIKAVGDIKSLMLPSRNDIASGLVKLGYEAKLGLNRPKDSTELDIGPVVEVADDVAAKLVEKFGKALSIEDLRTIVGNIASDLLLSTGDPSRKVDRFDFYEQNYATIVERAIAESQKRFENERAQTTSNVATESKQPPKEETKTNKQVAVDVKRIADVILTTQRVPSGDLDDRAQTMRGTGYGITPHPGGKEYQYDPWNTSRGTVDHAKAFAKSVFSHFVGSAREGDFSNIDKYLQYLGEAEKKLLLLDKFFESIKGVQVKGKSSAIKELTGNRDAYLREINEFREIITQVSSAEAQQAVAQSISTHMPKLAFDLSEESAKEVLDFDTKQPIESDIFEGGKFNAGNVYSFLRELGMNFQEIESAALYFDRMGDVGSLKKVSEVLSFMGRAMAIFNRDFEKIPTARDKDFYTPTRDKRVEEGKYLRELINGLLSKHGIDASSKDTQNVTQEAKEVSESLMTIGKAITIINNAIGRSTAKTTAGMAKAYANKIHSNADAVEAAKLLHNTPDSDLTSQLEQDTKKKLMDFHGAWRSTQQTEKPKVVVEPVIAPGAVAEEVKENVAETPVEAKVEPVVSNKPAEDYTSKQFVASLLKKEFEANGTNGISEETFDNWAQQLIDTVQTDDIATEIKQGIQDAIRDFNYTSPKFVSDLIKTEFANSGITDISDVTAMDWAKQLIDTIETEDVENEIKDGIKNAIVDYKEQMALAEQDDKDIPKETAMDKGTTSSQGGIIGIMRTELAQESTLQKVLTALGEIAKKNALAGAGKQNSAQDLLEQFRRMLESDAWEGRERVAYVDLATGSMSNSITGDDKSISAERLNILRTAYKDVMDLNAQVHTHANAEDPYFSKDDLSLFASDFADGITKQILLSKNNMTVLDMAEVKDVSGLLDALAKTEQNFEALATTANQFGAKYVSKAFNEITPQGLVKMLGIKGIESKYTETETRDSAVQGMLEEDAKVAADMLQESTGRAIKKTVERVGAELMTVTEKTDAKGNKTWSNQISDKYTKAALATNRAFKNLGLENEFGVGTDAQLALVDYTNKYEEFLRLIEEFKKNPKQEGLQAQFDKLLPELDAAEDKLNKLITAKDKFLNGKEAIKIFEGADLANAGKSLKDLATARYTQNSLKPGDNIAFNGISETANGTRLLVDILKDGTIQQYALEVDKATGQVKEFMVAETALANAFQNVNKAMRYNETVMADVARGNTPEEQAAFMNDAHSFGLDAYKESMADMEKYVADIWNRMANGGASASKEELDYIMALSERVITLGKEIQKTSIDFKNFWAQNPDNVFGHTIYHQGYNRDDRVREELEGKARAYASASNAEYNFSSFDNDTLQFTLTDAEGKISKVTYAWNELYQQIAMVSDKSTSTLDPMVAKINKYDEALQQAVKDGYLMNSDSNFDAFYKATDGIRSLVYGIEQGHETFDTAKDKLYELRQEALKYGELAKKTVAQNKRMFAGTGAKKSVDNQYNKIFGARQAGEEEFASQFADDSKLFVAYNKAYNQLNASYQKYVDNHQLNDPNIQQQIQQEALKVQTLGKRYLSSVTQAEKLKELVDQSGVYTDKKTGQAMSLGGTTNVTAQEVTNLKAKMLDYVENGLKQANIEGVKFDATNQRLIYTFRTSKNTVADMVVQYNDATSALYAYQKQERESLTGFAGFMHSMKAKMKSILQYTASITSIYRVFGELKRGIQYIKEIDSALTELRKVTNETNESYEKFLNTTAKTADKVGSTIKEIVSSTADWARLGYSLEQAATLAESTSVLLNVSEFQSIDEATSALTSTLQAFSYTAEQSMDVVDVLNEVGKLVARR